MYVKVSLRKAIGGGAGAPAAKDPNVIFIRVRDLAVDVDGKITGFPGRDAQGVRSTSDIILKDLEKAQAVYLTPSTINRFDTSEGDADKKGWLQNFSGEHPGDELGFAEWLQNNLNEDFILVSKDCGDGNGTRIHGTPCNPMQVNAEGQDNAEGIMSMITAAQLQRGKYKSMHYRGALPGLAADWVEGSSQGGL
ncbi:MAG: hypothetical protein RIC03_12500 [Cyclobacteriaceae bacterium]